MVLMQYTAPRTLLSVNATPRCACLNHVVHLRLATISLVSNPLRARSRQTPGFIIQQCSSLDIFSPLRTSECCRLECMTFFGGSNLHGTRMVFESNYVFCDVWWGQQQQRMATQQPQWPQTELKETTDAGIIGVTLTKPKPAKIVEFLNSQTASCRCASSVELQWLFVASSVKCLPWMCHVCETRVLL